MTLPALTSGCAEEDTDEGSDEGTGTGRDKDDAKATKDASDGKGSKDAGADASGKADSGSRIDSGSGGGRDARGDSEEDSGSKPSGDAGDGPMSGDASRGPTPPMFEDAPSCTLAPRDIEGPFLILEDEIPDDERMLRSDIRDGHEGCEFRFHLRFLHQSDSCASIPGVEAYIWHCDAAGYYSGYDGQNPAVTYTGGPNPDVARDKPERFCRGVQVSDDNGIVSFTTVYPGWYTGRPIHIHLLVRSPSTGDKLFTTQFYFPANLTRRIHDNEPAYMPRAAQIPRESLNPPSGLFGGQVGPTLSGITYTDRSGLVEGATNVITSRA